ncbi:transcription regulator HTH, apses-type DNA-binding domain-containing protein [Sporodiniella umbellata]|nr:transcription regulator HTH, apses-type DNA-binding domain-containing protein [Sporodiniella umbellata]
MEQVAEKNYSYGVFVYQKPKLLTTFWEEEGTMCYQVEYRTKKTEVVVSRRYDNDMVNITKLLNAVRMSRGRRDNITRLESNRVVIKHGPANLKGVWAPFTQAIDIAIKFKIYDDLFPLFEDDATIYLTASDPPVCKVFCWL